MIEEVTAYKTSDGDVHDSFGEAEDRERELVIKAMMKEMLSDLKDHDTSEAGPSNDAIDWVVEQLYESIETFRRIYDIHDKEIPAEEFPELDSDLKIVHSKEAVTENIVLGSTIEETLAAVPLK